MTQVIGSWEGVSHQPQATGLLLVHVTPGRVRLRATGNESRSVIATCAQLLRQQAGIEEVLTNHKTGSIVVSFDEKKLPLPQVLAAIAQASGLQVQLPVAETRKDPFAAWKSREFWQQQGIDLIPLIAGLTVTGTLGISGFATIPVYIVAAEATRFAIDFAKNEMGDKEEVKSQKLAFEPFASLKGKLREGLKACPQVKRRVKNDSRLRGANSEETSPSTRFPTPDYAALMRREPRLEPASRLPTPQNYKILHSIPGRIRIHVPRLAKDEVYVQQVERSLRADERVTKFRFNRDAASLTITYTPKDVPVSHWMELLQLAEQTRRSGRQGGQGSEGAEEQGSRGVIPNPKFQIPNSPTPDLSPLPTSQTKEESEDNLPFEAIAILPQPSEMEAAGLWNQLKPPALSMSLEFMVRFPLHTLAK